MSATIDRDYTTIAEYLEKSGVNRRDFMTFCSKLMVAAPFGLAITNYLSVDAVAAEVGAARRPSVIWLHMQECTGCTETLLRPWTPDLATLLLDLISLDYNETVMVAAGHDAEAVLEDAIKENDGKFILVVEGSTPTAEDGIYLKVADEKGIDRLRRVASHAAAIVAMGSCASWGGPQSADPNPTGAVGVDQIITDKPIINIPGCPPNPYVFLGVALQYAKTGTVPELDEFKRPKFAYDRVIHEHCPRRSHFDNGRFARQFGDSGHQQGWCLYMLGCKGPVTHAPCSTKHFNDVVDAWPIGIGAPCFGCTEKGVGYTLPLYETVKPQDVVGPATYPSIYPEQKGVSPIATGLAGVAAGAAVVAGVIAAKKLKDAPDAETKE